MPAPRAFAAFAGVALISIATSPTKADDQTLLIELDARSSALASAVSASGSVVVGGLADGGAFYWMPTTGVVFAGGMTADGVSGDGHTIVGWARDVAGIQQAAIWQRATEWRLLGSFPNATPCDAFLGGATDVSRNGQVVVGYAYQSCTSAHAFKWQESTGMVDLGSSVSGRSTSTGSAARVRHRETSTASSSPTGSGPTCSACRRRSRPTVPSRSTVACPTTRPARLAAP